MKKKIIVLLLILVSLPNMVLHATPPAADPGIAIEIHLAEGYSLHHLDILVLSSEVNKTIFSSPQPSYIARFGPVDDIEYLKHIEMDWVSYLAHVEDPSYEQYDDAIVRFAFEDDEYTYFSRIILIYFDNDGQTLLTEEMTLFDDHKQRQVRYGQIDLFIGDTIYVENNYRPGSNLTIVFLLLAVLVVLKAIFEYLKYFVPILFIIGIVAVILYVIQRLKVKKNT